MIETLLWAMACVIVIIVVTMHYEAMNAVSNYIIPWARHKLHNRRIIPIAISALLLAHIFEIWFFAAITVLLLQLPVFGQVEGPIAGTFYDFLYLSSVNYTSLGDSVLRLTGPVRVITATEPLVGMMMIAWSASFTYLEMEHIWSERRTKKKSH